MARPTFILVLLVASAAARAQEDKATAGKKALTQEAQSTINGSANAGNIYLLSVRGVLYYQLRFLSHGLRFDFTAGVAGQALDTDGKPATGYDVPLQRNINTAFNTRLRYDYFLTEDDTLYSSAQVVHDSASNLTGRLRADGGYRRFILRSPRQELSVEAGLTYSIDYGPFDGDTNGDGRVTIRDENRFEGSNGVVAGRTMVQYRLALTETLTLSESAEMVANLFPPVAAPYERTRIDENGDNQLGFLEATVVNSTTNLTVTISRSLALGLVLTAAYDFGAIARRNAYANWDVSVAAALTYKTM